MSRGTFRDVWGNVIFSYDETETEEEETIYQHENGIEEV